MQRSIQAFAAGAQTAHSYHPGFGYVKHDIPLDPGPHRRQCLAPQTIVNGSAHLLSPPGGPPAIRFVWVEAEQAWARSGGIRMAFTAGYLGSHGWTYTGPAK